MKGIFNSKLQKWEAFTFHAWESAVSSAQITVCLNSWTVAIHTSFTPFDHLSVQNSLKGKERRQIECKALTGTTKCAIITDRFAAICGHDGFGPKGFSLPFPKRKALDRTDTNRIWHLVDRTFSVSKMCRSVGWLQIQYSSQRWRQGCVNSPPPRPEEARMRDHAT